MVIDKGLREKIARAFGAALKHHGVEPITDLGAYADEVLAIPEIRDALRFVEGSPGFNTPHMADQCASVEPFATLPFEAAYPPARSGIQHG